MKAKAYLFVYGTLMRNFRNEYALYLHRRSAYVGRGSFTGFLFDLGDYPGAMVAENPNRRVHGDVFRLRKAAEVLRALDEYEGVGEQFPIPNEYRRAVVPVVVGEAVLPCWVYLYNHEPDPARSIDSGRYGG